jgi:hypothetical protein
MLGSLRVLVLVLVRVVPWVQGVRCLGRRPASRRVAAGLGWQSPGRRRPRARSLVRAPGCCSEVRGPRMAGVPRSHLLCWRVQASHRAVHAMVGLGRRHWRVRNAAHGVGGSPWL